jgi:hypothetical protein
MNTKRLQVVLLLTLVVLLGVLGAKHQALQDWWRLRGYTPPSMVVQLANQDTMNAYTRHLFYLNKPQLPTTVASFRKVCPENEDTIVLGCYHPVQNGIYIYAVQDQTLAGIQQVTAAHEVLHAVYARLSNAARSRLDSELESYDTNGLSDPTVKAEVALYRKTEPGSVYDEMSCTFGTEISHLPAALNQYYAQFFTNRQKVVGYAQQYQAQFTVRQQQIAMDDAQLTSQRQQITNLQDELASANNSLDVQKAQLQQMLSGGQVTTYDSAVAGYNTQVDNYNTELGQLKLTITSYNQLVATRNVLAGQLTTLDSAIDTRVPAAASP